MAGPRRTLALPYVERIVVQHSIPPLARGEPDRFSTATKTSANSTGSIRIAFTSRTSPRRDLDVFPAEPRGLSEDSSGPLNTSLYPPRLLRARRSRRRGSGPARHRDRATLCHTRGIGFARRARNDPPLPTPTRCRSARSAIAAGHRRVGPVADVHAIDGDRKPRHPALGRHRGTYRQPPSRARPAPRIRRLTFVLIWAVVTALEARRCPDRTASCRDPPRCGPGPNLLAETRCRAAAAVAAVLAVVVAISIPRGRVRYDRSASRRRTLWQFYLPRLPGRIPGLNAVSPSNSRPGRCGCAARSATSDGPHDATSRLGVPAVIRPAGWSRRGRDRRARTSPNPLGARRGRAARRRDRWQRRSASPLRDRVAPHRQQPARYSRGRYLLADHPVVRGRVAARPCPYRSARSHRGWGPRAMTFVLSVQGPRQRPGGTLARRRVSLVVSYRADRGRYRDRHRGAARRGSVRRANHGSGWSARSDRPVQAQETRRQLPSRHPHQARGLHLRPDRDDPARPPETRSRSRVLDGRGRRLAHCVYPPKTYTDNTHLTCPLPDISRARTLVVSRSGTAKTALIAHDGSSGYLADSTRTPRSVAGFAPSCPA